MTSCRSAVWVLLFLTVTTVCESERIPSVTVKLHDSAVLPCSERCSGVVRWTIFHKPKDILAECDQTSCRSLKEGYEMIYDQYLQGDLSLIIPEADFSKRAWYVCNCDDNDLCDVNLRIELLNISVQIKPGESLLLKLHVSDPVEVIYNGTAAADRTSRQICTVDGRSPHCRPEYTNRTSLSSALELRGMKQSDSGVYIVQDSRNEEDVHLYTVTVQDDSEAQDLEQKPSDPIRSVKTDCQDAALPGWAVAVLVVLAVVCVVSVGVNVVLWRKLQCLQAGSATNEDHHLNQMQGPEPPSPEDQEGHPLQSTPSDEQDEA